MIGDQLQLFETGKPRKIAPNSNTDLETIKEIASAWRIRGFPHYQLSMNERMSQIETFTKYDRSKMISGDVIKQTLHALGAVWHYFPHHWEVKVGKMRTALDVWNDEELFHKAIASRIKWGGYEINESGNPDMSPSYMRKALRTFSGVQRVSNFRPSAAACIYDQYANNGVVWDMSCGYGGRLLGAMVSDKVSKYIGTEPCGATYDGLSLMKKDYSYISKTEIELNQVGSEDFVPSEQVDLCFTSPPYFNTEIYSDEDSQSWKRYQTVESWNNDFLAKTISNCWESLKDNGHMILNVANVKSHPALEGDTVKIAKLQGFVHVKTLQLTLSSITKGGFKYEPVFVFTKEKQ